MADTFNKVVGIISKRLSKDADTITVDSKFREDLGADSLEVVELIMQLEDEFEIEISDEEAEKIVTVGDAVKFIDSL